MATAIIGLDHLQKDFDKLVALKDVSFTLASGQVLSFLRPNGTGRSAIVQVILGLLKKGSGSVTVFGKNAWRDDATIHPRIVYVPGDVYLWLNLSGGEIIDLLLRLNSRQHNQKTDELTKAFGFGPKKKACIYSRDNRQKVALITVLSQNADLYIFDEPTSKLDPLDEQIFQQEVLKLKRTDKNALLLSHILSEVKRMCDSIVVIRDDSVIESDSLDQSRHLSRIKIEVTTATPTTALTK